MFKKKDLKVDLKKLGKKKGKKGKEEPKEDKSPKIITIDNYNQRYYEIDNGTIKPLSKLSYKNKVITTTYIANKDMIISPIELSAGIPDDAVDGALEDRAYEELGLDPAIEYIIMHEEVENKPDDIQGRLFHMFIIESEKFEEMFENLVEEIKYIDLIIPAPLLYKTLYDSEILEPKKIQCFLYFSSYDTTITFYRNGDYLYSKSINYSLEQIYDRYCEILGKTVDKKEFMRIFQKEGAKTTKVEYQQNMLKLFNEIFININDIVIYTKRAYKIETIDQMYIGSEFGPIEGVDQYAQNYLGLYSIPFVLDFGYTFEDSYIDHTHLMMAKASEKFTEDPSLYINFTKYPRPPVFYKRPSGQFVIAVIGAITLASSYPIYFLLMAYANQGYIYTLEKKEEKLGAEVRKYKSQIAKLTKIKKDLEKRVDELRAIYKGKEKTLVSVYRKKVDYQLKSDRIALFADELNKNKVHTDRIMSSDDNYSIGMIAEDDQYITTLIKDITDKHKREIKHIDIDKIYKDDNSLYRGTLKVDLK